jgi:hypothetical protein
MLMMATVVANIGRRSVQGRPGGLNRAAGMYHGRADLLKLKERLAVMVSASIRWTIDRSLMQMESQE